MATTSPFDTDQYQKLSTGALIAPETQAFDEANGTAGRVNSIISSGSPLMKTAATKAAQAMQGRGLRNSSLAVQAGQQAVIETAAPIAQADANLFQQQSLANQAAKNTANQFNANTKTTVGLAGLDSAQKESQFGQSLMEQARQFNTGTDLEREKIAQSGGQFSQNLAFQREQFGATNDAEKARLAETMRQFDSQSQQQQQQFVQNLGLQRDQLTSQREQFAQQFGLDAQQLDLQRGQLSQQQQQFLADLDLKDRQLAQQEQQVKAQMANQVTIAKMDADNRLALAQVEAGYKADIAGNENISNAWGTMMSSINDIQNNPELDEASRRTAVQNQIDSFRSFTGFWKKASGGAVDVSDLLDFGAQDVAADPVPMADSPANQTNSGSGLARDGGG